MIVLECMVERSSLVRCFVDYKVIALNLSISSISNHILDQVTGTVLMAQLWLLDTVLSLALFAPGTKVSVNYSTV